MKKVWKILLYAAVGAFLTAMAVLLSAGLIRFMGPILGRVLPFFSDDAQLTEQLTAILGQLKTARLTHCCGIFALTSALLSVLSFVFFRKRRLLALKIPVFLILFLVFTVVVLAFTSVNDICLLGMVRVLLKVAPALI